MELYKFYSPLYSIPNLSARPPDLVTHLGQINKPGTFGTWPEVYAIKASTSPGFGQYDGRTYSARWAARITGQLLVERTNTFTFELDNREGAKLYLDGRLCIDNDWNVRDTDRGQPVRQAEQSPPRGRIPQHTSRVLRRLHVDATSPVVQRDQGSRATSGARPRKFFLPDSCCLCTCKGGQSTRRGLRHGRGGLFVAERRASVVTESTVARGEDRGGDGDGMTCAEPCETACGAASTIGDRAVTRAARRMTGLAASARTHLRAWVVVRCLVEWSYAQACVGARSLTRRLRRRLPSCP